MTGQTLIKVEQLTRLYDQHCAVDNLSFEVRRGEVLGFLGPNGAGKSTTMSMITGNLAPSHGRILINGIDILDQPKAAKAEIGYLPEQPPLYKELTVNEYLDFCSRLNRLSREKISGAIKSVKERCGLGDVGNRLIANLSKGYQQRVGIAQAIIHRPAVVVLDEPTVGLDPIQIRDIRNLIRELGGEHSVILSTHILPEVQTTCDQVQIINQGKLVFNDSIKALAQQMRASSLFIRLSSQIDVQVLLAIGGVQSVDKLEDGRLQINHDPEINPAAEIANTIISQGLELLELTPNKRSLEEIFVDITTLESDTTEGETIAVA